jgi:nucleoid-associated protein YgaU
MTGNKLVAIIAAMIAGGAALAVAALYIDWGRLFAPPAVEQGPVAGAAEPARSPSPQEAAPAAASETKSAGSEGISTAPSEPTTVPTFDVVVIEPGGEGVIAGRAAPGWKVNVQSGGVKVAEAKADLQGEWSVVLEKPLPSGDHALSLKITSPDGTRALSSQETVRVAVGTSPLQEITGSAGSSQNAPQTEGSAAVAQPVPESATADPSGPAAQTGAAAPPADPDAPRALARSEQQAANAPGAGESGAARVKPKIVFKTVDYIDSGSGTGTITITGTSEPGAKLSVFYDNHPLAEARADQNGQWRVQVAKTLSMGQHSFKVERSGAPPGMAGTAVVSIERVEPKPEPPASAVASREPAPGQSPKAATDGSASSPLVYVIRKGDTLWAIAKRYLGSGLRYPSIFQDNREIISNPDLIHPQQEVKVPPP